MFKVLAILIVSSFSFGFSRGDIDKISPNLPEIILDERVTPHEHETYESNFGETQVRIVITEDDFSKTITHDEININCKKGEGSLSLENEYFRIRSQSVFYIRGPVICQKLNVWKFEKESSEAQVLEIYHQAITARDKFIEKGLVNFWKRRINIKWPSNGDYYSWGTVNITRTSIA